MSDALEDIDGFVLARASIFSRLGALSVKIDCRKGTINKNTDREENLFVGVRGRKNNKLCHHHSLSSTFSFLPKCQ
jgi:hypothetical protein